MNRYISEFNKKSVKQINCDVDFDGVGVGRRFKNKSYKAKNKLSSHSIYTISTLVCIICFFMLLSLCMLWLSLL